MELGLESMAVTATQAVDGMRRPFMRTFGRGPLGRRLAEASWSAFRAALLHGAGIAVAASHAHVAAAERNARAALVAQWSSRRLEDVVRTAIRNAADAG